MRSWLLVLLALAGCGNRTTTSSNDAASYVPANPDLAVRIDLVAARTWAKWGGVASQAIAPIANDPCAKAALAEGKSVLVAKHGDWRTGDVTIVIDGAPAACRGDHGIYTLAHDGQTVATGKLLEGKLVVVRRAGKPLDAAGWNAKQPRGIIELPAVAIALRSITPQRTLVVTTTLGDPLVVHGKLDAPDAGGAKRDEQILSALATYLKDAQAGTLSQKPAVGSTVEADLTAEGTQLDTLLAFAVPTLVDPLVPKPDLACDSLDKAVEQYLMAAVGKTEPKLREALETRAKLVLPLLRVIYVDECKGKKWSPESIRCHVEAAGAAALARFERCREALTAEQRDALDKATNDAMTKAGAAK